jgi:aldo/keto reductase family protein
LRRAILGDWLRLYQIHSATLESGVLDDVEVLTTLAALRADGLVIGLTVSGPHQSDVIRRASAVQIDGTRLFQVVQATWNLLDPSAGSALAEAKALGWGVIIKEALANGRLTSRASNLPDSLRAFAAGHQTTVDVVAIAAAMSQPWADVVLSGAVTTQQLLSNVSAQRLLGKMIGIPSVAQTPAEYWTRRRAFMAIASEKCLPRLRRPTKGRAQAGLRRRSSRRLPVGGLLSQSGRVEMSSTDAVCPSRS